MTQPNNRRMTPMVAPKPPARTLAHTDTPERRAIERFRGGFVGAAAAMTDEQVQCLWASLPRDTQEQYLAELAKAEAAPPAPPAPPASDPPTDDE